jgi:hypothetical protein
MFFFNLLCSQWCQERENSLKQAKPAYLFCLGIVRLALRIGKPALEFGLALVLFRFVEYLFAFLLVFYRAGREFVRAGHQVGCAGVFPTRAAVDNGASLLPPALGSIHPRITRRLRRSSCSPPVLGHPVPCSAVYFFSSRP